jgi:hypothetical protein
MGRVVRLTEQEFKGLLNNILGLLSGGMETKTASQQKDIEQTVTKSETPVTSNKIVGSDWKSCNAWKSKGGLSGWGDKIKVDKNPSQFKISYKGPSSGLSIAHAANGGDTIHQLYNVLICEINPFLGQGKMKPKIDDIRTEGGKDGKDSTLSIIVPIESSKETYQLDRRGGWNHDPGSSNMKSKCDDVKSKGGKCFGPVKNIVQAPFGKITEYFITHTI